MSSIDIIVVVVAVLMIAGLACTSLRRAAPAPLR